MPKIEEKQVVVNDIKQKLEGAKSAILISARGLSVEQDTVLRRKLRQANVEYHVYKNTMLELAVKGTEFEGLTEFLSGPNTLALSYDDATAAARTINKELKSMPKLKFNGGVISGAVYSGEDVAKIAEIPPKEELLSKLLGSFKSPMASFARVIKAIADEKSTPAADAVSE
ncbi:MAG: 50S ribosomal protein L10 [Clostridiales bacterium]|nr:50S ribosomal protein L10 [Clostridiales bacterium]